MRNLIAGTVFLPTLTLACGSALARTILATTFPVYHLNITHGVPDAEVRLMLPAQAGCPTTTPLTPQDMGKLVQPTSSS